MKGSEKIMATKSRFYCDIMDIHDEVTGSCHLVIVKFPDGETMRFIVDCGLFQGQQVDKEEEYGDKDLNYRKFPFNAENIDFALITHVHVDHIGRLPYLVKSGYNNPIYTTNTTAMFLPLALNDSYKVLSSNAKRNNVSPLYKEEDVSKTLEMVKPCNYGSTINVNSNIRVTFFPNAHLLGAAMILVQISYIEQEDINILFSGDYAPKNMFTENVDLPEWVKKLRLTIVQESTYGDMDSDEIKPCFEQNILEAISKKKSIICPVFSLGRSQEIMYVLRKMQDDGKIAEDLPIYLDGKLAINYTNLYLKGQIEEIIPEMEDFLPYGIIFVDKVTRKNVLESRQCKIVLTTSGMGSYGPAQVYIPEYLSRRNALIHFTGYTPESTMGGKLKSAKYREIVEVGGLVVKKLAKVEYTAEFSAHGKADEMIAFLKNFKEAKLILVNHGEPEVKEIFAKRILDEVKPKRVGILGREYFFRVDSYGLVKTMSTKFK